MAGLTVPGLKPSTPYAGRAAPAGGLAAPGGFGAPAPAPKSTTPNNPTLMNTYGGATQQTDQMGRVITNSTAQPAGFGAYSFDANGNYRQGQVGGGITIEDPDQQRRARDLADEQTRRTMDRSDFEYQLSKTGGGGSGSGSGGGGGAGGDGGGGLDKNEIMDILDKLGGQTPPPREQAPGLLEREPDPVPVASAAAKSQGFARAKDNSGRLANAALRNLRSEMVSRGIEGSGVEGALTGNILGETARGVSDASFEQERAAEEQAWEGKKLGYQGRLGQRTGDQNTLTNNFNTNTTQRNQDINAQQNRLALAPTVLSMLNRARY